VADNYDTIINDAAAEWNLDPRLLKALILHESGGDPMAVSKAGAQGLGQIMPETQRQLGVTAPHDPVTGQITGTTIQEQTRQCLTNIAAILEEAGSSLDKIVTVTIILADEDDFAGMNEEWLRWFPSHPPARQGAKLPARIPGLKVSIAAVAETAGATAR